MGKRNAVVLAVALATVVAASARADDGHGPRGPMDPPRHAPRGQPYLLLRGGVFAPNSESDGLDGFDSGWNVNGGIGSRVNAIMAVEAMGGTYGADRGDDEVRVIPITAGLRFIAPHPFLEAYLGGGVGLYIVDFKQGKGEADEIDDSENTVGGYLSMGVDAWMSPRMALNLEGSYQFAQASFEREGDEDFDVNVGGWTVNLGIRLDF